MTLRAVYFDLDDTLCGYWGASKVALREAFSLHPVPGHSVDEMFEHWARAFRRFSVSLKETGWYETYCKVGEPTRTEQMRLTLEEAGVQDEGLARILGDTYAEIRDRNLKLFDDAIMVLDALNARYPLGLVTNGPADIQRQEIATLGIEGYFQHIFIEGEMGVGKPHKVVFERAASAVRAEPHELLFVGNSYGHDIRPAVELGWHTAWIRRDSDVAPSRTKPESKPEGAPDPSIEIGSLTELLDFIGPEE